MRLKGRNEIFKLVFAVSLLAIIGGWGIINAQQNEVSTKVVGFVKVDVPENTGKVYFFYSIPFQEISATPRKHYLNVDANNDGTYEGASEMFSTRHFTAGDEIRKFDPSQGTFTKTARFYNQSGTSYPITGWYQQLKPPYKWEPSPMYFEDGEGFVVKYITPPDTRGELFFLGEVKDTPVTKNISPGYNLISNPFPVKISVQDAFNATTGSPLAGTSISNSDFIRSDFDPATGIWNRYLAYMNGSQGIKWYEQQKTPPYKWAVSTTELDPTEPFYYYSRSTTNWTWTANSPLDNE